MRPVLGSPAPAMSSRSSATLGSGTRMMVPFSLMRYSIPFSFSFTTMPDASSGLSEENSGRKDPSCCWRVNHETPEVIRSTHIKMLQRCATESDLYSFLSCSILGGGSIAAARNSHLHLHHFLICRYHLVANLQ